VVVSFDLTRKYLFCQIRCNFQDIYHFPPYSVERRIENNKSNNNNTGNNNIQQQKFDNINNSYDKKDTTINLRDNKWERDEIKEIVVVILASAILKI
jgi:hypothetical protein